MRDGTKALIIVAIAAAVLMVALLATATSAADEAATPTVEPLPAFQAQHKHFDRSPASRELIAWASGWRRRAARELALVNRARACFDLHPLHLKLRVPPRSSWGAVWTAAGRQWRTATHSYDAEFHRLRHRMSHPGGAGPHRWRPLVRWYWPAPLVETALHVIALESGGNEHARNGSGAAGLFQLYPAPSRWADPDYNVWAAFHRKYLPAGGWSPWVVMH